MCQSKHVDPSHSQFSKLWSGEIPENIQEQWQRQETTAEGKKGKTIKET